MRAENSRGPAASEQEEGWEHGPVTEEGLKPPEWLSSDKVNLSRCVFRRYESLPVGVKGTRSPAARPEPPRRGGARLTPSAARGSRAAASNTRILRSEGGETLA